jgi:hypothetical protein
MNRLSVAGISILGTLAVALVLGTQFLNGDPNSTNVVTVLGLLGLGISQLIGQKEAADTREKTEELSKDLHNGTFERLLREALTKLAEEKHFPLEIQNKGKEGEQ